MRRGSGGGADAADVVMVRRLRRAGLVLVADDLGAVLAELAVHARLAVDDLADALGEAVEHEAVVAQIRRLEELDLRMNRGDAVGGGVDALHQHAGEEEVREDDDAAEAQAQDALERRLDQRRGHAAERRLGPAEAHALPQHARHLGDVRIGIGIVGAASDHEQQRVGALGAALGARLGRGDAVGGGAQQLGLDRQLAAEAQLDRRVGGGEAVHLPGQVVLDVARREEHAGHGEDAPRALRFERLEPVADGRAHEFEIAGLDRQGGEARLDPGGDQRELGDGFVVAAAMAANHHRCVHFCSFAACAQSRLTESPRRADLDRRCCCSPAPAPTRFCSCSRPSPSTWRWASCRRCSACCRTRWRWPDAPSAGSIITSTASGATSRRGARAAIESLAENFSDGVVAPALFYALFGLPGIFVYKTANTLDSMIGHKTPHYLQFGWAAARLDDLLNLVPARLSGVLLAAAALATPRARALPALRTMLRDARKHRSPNAGWPEAAAAGALDLALAGPRRYQGHVVNDPWLGEGRARATPADIDRALRLYLTACLLQWALVAAAYLAVEGPGL